MHKDISLNDWIKYMHHNKVYGSSAESAAIEFLRREWHLCETCNGRGNAKYYVEPDESEVRKCKTCGGCGFKSQPTPQDTEDIKRQMEYFGYNS